MRIVIVGGGLVGTCSGMLLADDGHEVTILERDPAPPSDPAKAWTDWERRGVNQFRLPHFFLSRFRQVVEAELPRLSAALLASGACRYNIVANIPEQMKGASRADDDRFDVITGRRCVVEAVVARVAEATPRLTVRRGAAVRGIVTAPSLEEAVPHATGVELETGERIEADLVVDASGRRSPLMRWVAEAGGPPPGEELDDSGFVYFGRHFRAPDGQLPPMIGPLKMDCGSISTLTLPADNGTWSVTIIASAKDTALRRLSDPDRWERVVRSLPLVAHWLDGEPIDDGVGVMAKIEDRIRDFAPEGQPVVTGVLAVGDSWSCTNPSLGRGASVGLMHAVLLRDTLRQAGTDHRTLTAEWYEQTRAQMEPWYRGTHNYDRLRLAQVQAIIDGADFATDDPEWRTIGGAESFSLVEPDLLRVNLEIAMLLRRADDAAQDEAVRLLIDRHAGAEIPPGLGPTRDGLLAAIA